MIGEMLQSSILERIALQVLANAVGAHIATAKVIRTFLIIETLDFLGFYLLPGSLGAWEPSAIAQCLR
jgi:hypothetical protein